jgi:RNA polymerase primary sigma factor
LEKTLSILTARERAIIEFYYGLNSNYEPMTLEAIGDKFSLTKERIRQIKERAIRKLRFNSSDLYDILNK